MKVGRRHRDVAQPGNLERVQIDLIPGHIESPLVDLGTARLLPVIVDDAKLSEHAPADAWSFVALAATCINERLQTSSLIRRECVTFSVEVFVKPRWGQQGPLISADGFAPILDRDRIGFVRKCLAE